jgi:DNA-binding transcriptional LysR family regulator
MGDFAAVAGTLKEGPAQSVTISADDSIAFYVSDASWAELRRSHPSLGITVLTRRPHSEVYDVRADVAISHVRPKVATARSPGALDIGLFAQRDYLSRAGTPETVADLEQFCMVTAESDEARDWLETRLGLPAGCGRSSFRTDSCAGQLAAIEAGVGIGACYVGLAKGRADLVRVLPKVAASLDCWVWSLRSHARHGAAGLVFDSLMATLSEQVGSAESGKTVRPVVAALKSIAA